ncbi:unnamed protein product [Heligmosomoides polygyrus]|uniref:Uncharacterized protein n=1 Tax=Heligmosomoides polygyrus TaxID=6339 RepID=A0A183G4M5_HELPZ|nr:unnamed protein product [Heligmosomoides polygyrus]
MRLVCLELVQMLTGPKRGFDARVIDHYGPLAESAEIPPCAEFGCESSQRRRSAPRLANNGVPGAAPRRCLEHPTAAEVHTEAEEAEGRDKDKDAKRPHSNDDAEPTAKMKKLPKRPDVMYLRDPKKKREEQAPKMKQKGRGPYKSHQEMTRSRSGV